jgi:hypothetical protein
MHSLLLPVVLLLFLPESTFNLGTGWPFHGKPENRVREIARHPKDSPFQLAKAGSQEVKLCRIVVNFQSRTAPLKRF